jgi:S1-C subfamily serine protease
MRRRRGLGAEVTRVEPASIADRAGLSAGDIITLVANTESPSPNQVVRSYASLRPGDRVMVAVTRGETHYVTVFGR